MSELMSKLKSVSVEHRSVGTSWAFPMCGRAGISPSPFTCAIFLDITIHDGFQALVTMVLRAASDLGMSSLLTVGGRIEIYRTTASLLPHSLLVLLLSKGW